MASISSTSGTNGLSDYFSSKINSLFSKADTGGDGQISLSEFEAVGQNLPSSQSQAGNTDRASLFKQIDGNGDGQLSKDEVSAFAKQQQAQAQSALLNLQELFGGGGSSKAHGHHGHHHQSQDANSTTSDSTDGSNSSDPLSLLLSALNGSGSSTTSGGNSNTSSDPTSKLFASIDGNNDGSISQNELSGFLSRYQQTASAV